MSGAGAAAGRNVRNGQYAPAMANFAVRLVHGPGWDSSRQIRDQAGWDEHAAFMDGLVDDGFVILGGPVGDGEQTLHVVEAADENERRPRPAGGDGDHKSVLGPELEQILPEVSGTPALHRE